MFRSSRLWATDTCRFSHPRPLLRLVPVLVASCLVGDHLQHEPNCSPPQSKPVREIVYSYAESLGNPQHRRKADRRSASTTANLSKGLICLLKHLSRMTCAVSRRLIPRTDVMLEIFLQIFEGFVPIPASHGQEPIYGDSLEHKARPFMNPRRDLILIHTQTPRARL